MKFGSLFAGIGGFDLGLERAGMTCKWQVEKDERCISVLERHFPDAPRHDDVRTFNAKDAIRVGLIVGGFPCQDLSVAGARRGLAGERSGLFFEFIRIVSELAPRWVLIENVPGLLSSNQGRDMGAILGSLGHLGYGFAYRVLDAQYFGLAQRRKRVFIVGCAGDARRACQVLFEPESMFRDSPPSRETGTRVAASLTQGSGVNSNAPGRRREDDVNIALCLNGKQRSRYDGESETFVSAPLTVSPHADNESQESRLVVGALASHSKEHGHAMTTQQAAEAGQLIPFDTTQITSAGNYSNPGPGAPCHPLASQQHPPAVAFRTSGNCGVMPQGDRTAALNTATDPCQQIVQHAMSVRRLMPIECERLQGFPDDWTRYDAAGNEISDSARYRMIGNAVAVPVAEWIGRQILKAESEKTDG